MRNGLLDATFNITGVRVIDLGPADGLAIQPSGQIVISGTGAEGYLIRLNASDGSTDTSFGTGGTGVVTLPGTVFKISTISPSDGRLIVMGQSSGNQTVSRFSVDGVLDTTFATAGVFSANLGYLGGEASVSVQPDGNIIIARTVYSSYPTAANVSAWPA